MTAEIKVRNVLCNYSGQNCVSLTSLVETSIDGRSMGCRAEVGYRLGQKAHGDSPSEQK